MVTGSQTQQDLILITGQLPGDKQIINAPRARTIKDDHHLPFGHFRYSISIGLLQGTRNSGRIPLACPWQKSWAGLEITLGSSSFHQAPR